MGFPSRIGKDLVFLSLNEFPRFSKIPVARVTSRLQFVEIGLYYG
jgi:hypothetical protein